MNGRAIRIVYGKELRDSLRDRRTIISMIVVPVLVMPLLMFGVGALMMKTMTKARQEIPRVMIIGGENSPKVLSALRAARNFQIVPATEDFTNQIVEKTVRAVVKLPPDFDAALARGDKAKVEIYEYQGEIKSGFAAENLNAFFRNLQDATVQERLENRGVPVEVLKPFTIQRQNVAPPAKVTGNVLGGILPYVIIIFCLTGAMYPALDVTAGEKERGTMETILCCPIGRTDLVLGKFLMVLTASIGTVVLSLLSMGTTFHFAKRAMAGSLPQAALKTVASIDIGGLAGMFLMLLPVAVTLSAVLLMVGLFSRSFREAQSYCGPLMFVAIVPTVVAMLPGVDLNASFAVVPLLNVSLVCKEMIAGTWHWNYILLIFGSACLYAATALAATVWMFHREEVLFRS
ncbi:MAG: ABC transporter permease [Verrucomicrobiota bacterium]|jgi:sodium transport system permease protein